MQKRCALLARPRATSSAAGTRKTRAAAAVRALARACTHLRAPPPPRICTLPRLRVSRLEGGCVIYKGQSEAVIYARYLPGSVRSRVIYRGQSEAALSTRWSVRSRVIYGACLRSGANLGPSAPLRPPWGPMRGCGRPMGPRGGLWGPHGAPWGAVRGAVRAVWGTQLLV